MVDQCKEMNTDVGCVPWRSPFSDRDSCSFTPIRRTLLQEHEQEQEQAHWYCKGVHLHRIAFASLRFAFASPTTW